MAAPTRGRLQRRSVRDNCDIGHHSPPHGLVEFANHFREPAGPGVVLHETPRYRLRLQPDYPLPGPNSVTWIRCGGDAADDVITEVRDLVSPHHLPLMWILDPETAPADFAMYLAARDVHPEPRSPEVAVMVLGIEAEISHPDIAGLEVQDALASSEAFRHADAVNAEAFGDTERWPDAQERRRLQQRGAGNRRVLLMTIDGEPAGSGGMTLFPPRGAIINGGAVRPKFRGRGVYRALLAARLAIAREAGVAGLTVWGGPMSEPILRALGFRSVGWRRFYLDRSALDAQG